ncbi:TSUP family transporter [Sphingomonas koreensis]
MEFTAEIIAFLLAVAFVAGTIDAMAGGGGLLTIPALMAVGVPPVAAIATNKLQSAFGTASACIAYWRGGHLDLRRFAMPAAGAFIGSAAGAFTVQRIDPGFLTAFVPILLILMAIYFLLAPPMGEADRHARLGSAGLTAVSVVLGFYDGFFGPGAGSFLTTMMVALAGLGLVRAIANAKFLNFATNVAGLLAMIAGGKVLWMIGFGMAASNVLGNQIGARLAMRFGGKGVRPLLVLMSIALTVKLLSDPANPIWAWLPG